MFCTGAIHTKLLFSANKLVSNVKIESVESAECILSTCLTNSLKQKRMNSCCLQGEAELCCVVKIGGAPGALDWVGAPRSVSLSLVTQSKSKKALAHGI